MGQLYQPLSHGDDRDFSENAAKIRHWLDVLQDEPTAQLQYACFNLKEAEETRKLLTESEAKRVVFTWLEYKRL